MQLLVFRHGIAEEQGPDGTDASRRLTSEGVEKTKEAARGLEHLADRPEAILTSPKIRAAQTAQIVAKAFDMKPETLDVLADGPPRDILRALGRRKEEIIMIVGHEPTLSETIELVCTGGKAGKFIELKKSGCACVDIERAGVEKLGGGRLAWLATPKMLREIDRG